MLCVQLAIKLVLEKNQVCLQAVFSFINKITHILLKTDLYIVADASGCQYALKVHR